jgi:hypothetical protein
MSEWTLVMQFAEKRCKQEMLFFAKWRKPENDQAPPVMNRYSNKAPRLRTAIR